MKDSRLPTGALAPCRFGPAARLGLLASCILGFGVAAAAASEGPGAPMAQRRERGPGLGQRSNAATATATATPSLAGVQAAGAVPAAAGPCPRQPATSSPVAGKAAEDANTVAEPTGSQNEPTASSSAAPDGPTLALYRCFVQQLDRRDHELAPVPKSAGLALYFWHQLGEATRELGGAPELQWCLPWFVQPLRRAQASLLQERRGKAGPALSPQGAGQTPSALAVGATALAPTAKSEAVVTAATSFGGSERRGATEAVVRAALADPNMATWQLSPSEQEYIVAAATAIEALLFHVPAFHAYTYAAKGVPTALDAQKSRSQFVERTSQVALLAREGGTDETVLLGLGLSAGLLVDLFAHGGRGHLEAAALHLSHAALGTAASVARVDRRAAEHAVVSLWSQVFDDRRPRPRLPVAVARNLLDGHREEAVLPALRRIEQGARPVDIDLLWQKVADAKAYRALGLGLAPPADAARWPLDETIAAIMQRLARPAASSSSQASANDASLSAGR